MYPSLVNRIQGGHDNLVNYVVEAQHRQQRERQEVSMIQPIGGKKLFVLDTNVILHDGECFLNFDEHDVIIPMVVLEELDKFKKEENRNLQARRFLRK